MTSMYLTIGLYYSCKQNTDKTSCFMVSKDF